MIRKAKAIWRGTGRDGRGNLTTDSGVLDDTPYSFRTRFENEKGTNPEELIAAAHAGCFTMALAFGPQAAGFTPTELSTEAAVTLEPPRQRHAEAGGVRRRDQLLGIRAGRLLEPGAEPVVAADLAALGLEGALPALEPALPDRRCFANWHGIPRAEVMR